MRTHSPAILLIGAAVISAFHDPLSAQETRCDQVKTLAKMARAKSVTILTAEHQKAGTSYNSQLVFAARLFELRPKERDAALRLLDLIPKDEVQQTAWMTLGENLCDAEPIFDMTSLGRIRDNLPRNWAWAVLLAGEKLGDYVAYAITSVQDPHSDYAMQMQAVCQKQHPEFVRAVNRLPPNKKDWFVGRVLNPETCRAIAVPEAQ